MEAASFRDSDFFQDPKDILCWRKLQLKNIIYITNGFVYFVFCKALPPSTQYYLETYI
jgi:hypothetical protein